LNPGLPATAVFELPPRYSSGKAFGRAGEAAAARYLSDLGFRILKTGYRTRAGEIDIVAEEAGTVVFVEVKARSTLACGRPAEAVDRRKRMRILRAAGIFLMLAGMTERPCRFDVVEVIPGPDGILKVTLIRDAFQSS
jgi:putative endonuclease